jgi:hypothetical protein
MGVAHALLRAVSALLPRPLESNNIDKRSENRLTDEEGAWYHHGRGARTLACRLGTPAETSGVK